MSPPYDRYDRGSSRQRLWTHWVPLAVTITVATAGLASWIWAQRRGDEDDGGAEGGVNLTYDNTDYRANSGFASHEDSRDLNKGDSQHAVEVTGVSQASRDEIGAGWSAMVSNALRRTPSPQQLLNTTGSRVAASVAAMSKALSSIREEDNPWSEEADDKRERTAPPSAKRRKKVAIVVSADAHIDEESVDNPPHIASMLSHIPQKNDGSKIELIVLIYSPNIDEAALDTISNALLPPSLSSSFSNVWHDQGQATPDEELKSSEATLPGNTAAFKAIHTEAVSLVEKKTQIIPFTTSSGHTHILRQIQPDIIYLEESLAGENGSIVTNLQTWLRHDVVLVVGTESGAGGLADSEPEADGGEKDEKLWWQKPERVGRGRGIIVVDGMRVHDDWARRVQGQE